LAETRKVIGGILGAIFFIGAAVGYFVADMQMIGSPIWQVVITALGIGSVASSLGYAFGYLIGLGPDQISYRKERRTKGKTLTTREQDHKTRAIERKLRVEGFEKKRAERLLQGKKDTAARYEGMKNYTGPSREKVINHIKSMPVDSIANIYDMAKTYLINIRIIENITIELIDKGEISAELNAFKGTIRITEKKLTEVSDQNEYIR